MGSARPERSNRLAPRERPSGPGFAPPGSGRRRAERRVWEAHMTTLEIPDAALATPPAARETATHPRIGARMDALGRAGGTGPCVAVEA